MSDNTTETQNTGNSRRKFLTRASAGAAFTLLPAKSVWANGVTHSIVASGHGSDWAAGQQLSLKSISDWTSATDANVLTELKRSFEDVFGFAPPLFAGGTAVKLERNNASNTELPISLRDVLRGFRKYLVRLTANNGTELTSWQLTADSTAGSLENSSMLVTPQNGNPSFYANRYQVFFSSENEIAAKMVAVYLNAKFDGQVVGVNYPVINKGGVDDPRGLFNSDVEFANYLTDNYNSDPSTLVYSLDQLLS